MQTIIDSSPLSSSRYVLVGGQPVLLLRGQPIVWLSITPRNIVLLPTTWPRFPVVIDTGFNATALISHKQLRDWGGVEHSQLVAIPPGRAGWRRIDNQPVPSYMATLWLHRNKPGEHDVLSAAEPLALYPSSGILVTPPSVPARRLPLMGTELLQSCGLQVSFDPIAVDPAVSRFELRFSVHSLLEP